MNLAYARSVRVPTLLSLRLPRLELPNQSFYLNTLSTVQAQWETVVSTGGIFHFAKQQPSPCQAGLAQAERAGAWEAGTQDLAVISHAGSFLTCKTPIWLGHSLS